MTTDPSSLYAATLAALPAPLPAPEINPDRLDLESLKVVARLRRHGHLAYLVGGCVRDLLVGAMPKDYDVATSARPEEIREVFRNSRLIGRRFRLAHVYFPGGKIIEVATFRGKPVEVDAGEGASDLLLTDDNQWGNAEEDAIRRDFTVNGLFYDTAEGRVIDYVGGREDLEKRSIRTIGDPEIRLREDPVRGLRAARIAGKLGFSIEDATFAAMVRHADELPRCAPARVLEETLKLLRSGASRIAFQHLRRANILRVLLPSVEDMLQRGGPSAEAALFARLGALDALLAERRAISDAVMLSTMLSFLPLNPEDENDDDESESEVEGDESEAPRRAQPNVDRVLAEMSQHARLPRKIADRVRSILGSQRLFTESPKKKRRRGSGGFVRTPHFEESLQLFEIGVRATGENQAALDRWVLKAAQARERGEAALIPPPVAIEPEVPPVLVPETAAATEEAASAPTASAGAPAKKRRRRGGRRHRGAGTPTDGSEPPAGDGTAS